MTTGPTSAPLFGPPPGDPGLFGGGSVLDTATGVAAAADQWSTGVANLDLDAFGYALFEASLQRPGPAPEQVAGRRASLLMLARRFRDALAALPPDVVLPPPGQDLVRDHLVLATCRAALGDDGALDWLRQVAPMVSTTDAAGYIAHCLLRVGDARSDHELSEASLGQLQRLGDKGREIVPRMAADVIGRRPRGRPAGPAGRTRLWGSRKDNPTSRAVKDAAAVLRSGTDLVHTASESFVSDPQLVLDTADLLNRRGDEAGAALLLSAVDRTNPHVGRTEAALAAYVPAGTRGRRRLRRGVLLGLGAVVFVVSGVAGYPALALGWGLLTGGIEIFARAPGLSRFDSGVVDAYAERAGLRPFFLVPRSVADEPPSGHTRPVLPLLLGLVALVVGILVFPAAVRTAASHGPSTGWVTSPGLGCFLVWILLFPVLVSWAVSLLPGRRLGYAVPRLDGAEAGCGCRKWVQVSGPFAFAYSATHLSGVATPSVLQPVLQGYRPLPPSVSSCPVTGAAWLVLTLGPENGKILLRSPLGTFPDPPPDPRPDDVPTGQYL